MSRNCCALHRVAREPATDCLAVAGTVRPSHEISKVRQSMLGLVKRNHDMPRIIGWFNRGTTRNSTVWLKSSANCNEIVASLVDSTTVSSAKLTRSGLLACRHWTQFGAAAFTISSIDDEIKLCVAPESTIDDVFWFPITTGSSKRLGSAFETFVTCARFVYQASTRCNILLCYADKRAVVPVLSFLVGLFARRDCRVRLHRSRRLLRLRHSICHAMLAGYENWHVAHLANCHHRACLLGYASSFWQCDWACHICHKSSLDADYFCVVGCDRNGLCHCDRIAAVVICCYDCRRSGNQATTFERRWVKTHRRGMDCC